MIGDDRVQATGDAQFRQLLESFAQAVWETDAKGAVVVDSPSWRAYTGQSREEIMGSGWLDVVYPDDRDYVAARWSEAIATGQSYDADFRLRHISNDWRWTNVRAIAVRDAQGNVEKWIGLNIDIDERKQAEDTKKLLLSELRHRVRNTVGIMRSLARQTARHSDNMDDFCNHLEGRLSAVARTQAQIMRDPLSGVDLETLIAEEMLSLHAREGEQLSLKGPAVSLVPGAAEKIGLAIHELGTNALKYGALAGEAGAVEVRWKLADDMLKLEWKEHSPAMGQPPLEYNGFGTELIEHILQYDLSAQTTLEFTERGLHCTIAIPGKFLRA